MLAELHSSRLAKIYCEEPGQKKALAAYITLNRVPHPATMQGTSPLDNGGVQLCAYACPVLDLNFPEFSLSPCRALWRLITNDIPDFNTLDGQAQFLTEMVGCIKPPPDGISDLTNAAIAMYYILTGNLELPDQFQDSNWPSTIFGSLARPRPILCDIIYPGPTGARPKKIIVNGPFEPYNEPLPSLVPRGGFLNSPGTHFCECFCEVSYQYLRPANTMHHGGCIELKVKAALGSNAKCSVEIVGTNGAPIALPANFPQAPVYPKIILSTNCGR